MIVNFYKMKYGNYRNCELLATRNIEYVPNDSMFVEYNGQHFQISRVFFQHR
jgi:hypothetical protein|nr:MAG TPA: hypothetical protein [Caudoviricetes sp.]